MNWHRWGLREWMGMVERNNSFPVCQSVADSEGNVCVCARKYRWEGDAKHGSNRSNPWRMVILLLRCPANTDKALSLFNNQTTCQRQYQWPQPNPNSWQIFHFLLFTVFTKSSYSCWSQCKWKVKVCDTESQSSISAKHCDKQFPSCESQGLGQDLLLGSVPEPRAGEPCPPTPAAVPPGVRKSHLGQAFCERQSLCVSWRNAAEALEFNLINADNKCSSC